MAQTIHSDVFNDGLTAITSNANMNIVVTAGVPTFAQASALWDSGTPGTPGRVSNVISLPASDAVLEDAAGGAAPFKARRARILEKAGTVAVSVSGQDLHICIYDGTRLLVVNDETSDQALTLNNPITIPTFNITLNQPV